jgi:hypothetical protein
MFSGNERFFVLDFWFAISLGSDFVETGFRARLLVACSPVSTNRNQGGYFCYPFFLVASYWSRSCFSVFFLVC